MQEAEKLPGDAEGVSSPPARRRCNRGTCPWREVIGEFRASGLPAVSVPPRVGATGGLCSDSRP